MDVGTVMTLALACAPLVDPVTVRAVVAVESASNPNAIGVVGGVLERQPRNPAEARATARTLDRQGWNYSVGLAQVNAANFRRLGLTLETALEPCANLQAMQVVLTDCFERTGTSDPQESLRAALSCYFSGDFRTGFRSGYVRRVVSASYVAIPRPTSTRL